MKNFNPRNNGGRFRDSNGNHRDYQHAAPPQSPESIWSEAGYQSKWVKESIDSTFPDFAENIGKYMAVNGLTNSKIRSIYGEMKRIQMGDYEKEKASFYLLRPKVAYALGRDPKNRGLLLFKLLFDYCSKDVTGKKSFLNFCNIFEAVLAYHKAFGGKD